MSASLLKFAREHSSVVAVMGRGHLAGVEKHWNQPIEVSTIKYYIVSWLIFFVDTVPRIRKS